VAPEKAHEHEHEEAPLTDLGRIKAVRDAGAHRASDQERPFSLHLVGLGKAGAAVITQLLRNRPKGFLTDPRTRFTALAVDIGDQDLRAVRDAAANLPGDRAQVRTVALPVPEREDLMASLRRYREFLKREYPRYYWNPNFEPWLPSDIELPRAGDHFPRTVAKAIYGVEYYQGDEIAREMEAFAESVDASEAVPMVCVIFSLAGGTGSGVVGDLARHLATVKLGRRPLVVGIGILPCAGDPAETYDGRLFPVINELDCMIDTEKNKGVMVVWGDLYKNPFTSGFFVVPQNAVYELTGDLAATHAYVNEGLASFLARDGGIHLYETLKLLNWLSVPADRWHPAVRAEPTEQWVNVLTSRRLEDVATLGELDMGPGVDAGYVEARVFADEKAGADVEVQVREQVGSSVKTAIEPGVLRFDAEGQPNVNLFVPRATKLDLNLFVPAREAYDQLSWEEKMLRHSWLLELNTLLCEPSTRFEGMAGECILGCACWVVVPYAAIRGEVKEAAAVQ
jgi:hypothetical protein